MIHLASGWFGARPRLASAQLRLAADLGFPGLALLPGEPSLGLEGLAQARSDIGSAFVAAAWDSLQDPGDQDASLGISSIDPSAWRAAEALVQGALERLLALGARILIVPAGLDRTPGVQERSDRLLGRLRGRQDIGEGDEALEELLVLSSRDRGRQLEALARFLSGLKKAAPGLQLALVPDPSPAGLLDLEALKLLLDDPGLAGLGLWFDTAVAEARAALAHEPPGLWLDSLARHLAGATLQDFSAGCDHLPPGEGQVDWRLVAEYLPRRSVRVLALAPSYPGETALEARRCLQGFGIS